MMGDIIILPRYRHTEGIFLLLYCSYFLRFKHSVGTEKIDKQTICKRSWRRYQDETNHYHYIWYHKFGVGIGVSNRDRNTITVVPCQDKILLPLVSYPKGSVTNGNQPQNILSYLMPDQTIVLHLVPDQAIVSHLVPEQGIGVTLKFSQMISNLVSIFFFIIIS